jgi:alcohol dehydrogenase
MKEITFRSPARIEIGLGKAGRLKELLAQREFQKVLLIVDRQVRKIGLVDPLLAGLRELQISYELFDGIEKEPTVRECDAWAAQFGQARSFQAVIGIGGGSALDVAKILSVCDTFAGSVRSYFTASAIDRRERYLALIPTTSGTGSEATPNAVLIDEENRCKRALVSDCLIPDVAIIDPELTFALPPRVTAETGMDAFTHGIECFIGKKANMMSDLFALEAVRLIAGSIRKAMADGRDGEARHTMALASLYGGIAIANSGTGGVHALAYPLGGEYGVGHGLSNSILLAEVMEFNAKAVPERFLEIGKALGLSRPGTGSRQQVGRVLEEIRGLVRAVGIKLVSAGFTASQIDGLARSAMSQERLLANNPCPIGLEDARRIYRRALP